MEQQAQNMLERTRGKLHEVKVGEYFAVFISEFGRGKRGPSNIIGVVLQIVTKSLNRTRLNL